MVRLGPDVKISRNNLVNKENQERDPGQLLVCCISYWDFNIIGGNSMYREWERVRRRYSILCVEIVAIFPSEHLAANELTPVWQNCLF